MKLREILRRIDLVLRPPHVKGQGGGGEAIDARLDALAGARGAQAEGLTNVAPGAAPPPNWVPSQQDERPRY